ncbi:beta-lactamase-like protein [Chlamydoabsidia padenii]|nr:beta-lactamase-like protein [Chlamydoabsidia padenii]
MKEYNGVEHLGAPSRLRFIHCTNLFPDKKAPFPGSRLRTNLDELKNLLGLSKIQAVAVDHCRYAYGLVLNHKTGWKLVYSGDTRPCDRLIEAGQGATLLIHEATLEDDMMEEAIAKKHSTTAEAVEVGQKMKTRYTLLNHFSQRYAKVPILSEKQENVAISFDMMSVFIKQIPLLPKFNRAMQLIFKDAEEEYEEENIEGNGGGSQATRKNDGQTNIKTKNRSNKKRKLDTKTDLL